MEEGIKMVSAVAEIFAFRRLNPNIEKEDILQHIANFVATERDEQTKIAMVAAASKAADMIENNPYLSEKETIRTIMQEIPSILMTVSENVEKH
jgi:hypothetical protein